MLQVIKINYFPAAHTPIPCLCSFSVIFQFLIRPLELLCFLYWVTSWSIRPVPAYLPPPCVSLYSQIGCPLGVEQVTGDIVVRLERNMLVFFYAINTNFVMWTFFYGVTDRYIRYKTTTVRSRERKARHDMNPMGQARAAIEIFNRVLESFLCVVAIWVLSLSEIALKDCW